MHPGGLLRAASWARFFSVQLQTAYTHYNLIRILLWEQKKNEMLLKINILTLEKGQRERKSWSVNRIGPLRRGMKTRRTTHLSFSTLAEIEFWMTQ